MLIGCSTVDITPLTPAPMAGQPFACIAGGVTTPLNLHALLIDDQNVVALILSADTLLFSNPLAHELRNLAAQAVNMEPSCVALTATHTHSGPSILSVLGSGTDNRYEDLLRTRVVEAARRAATSAVKAEFSVAADTVQNLGFNRRFIMSNGEIETHPLKNNPHIVRSEGPDSGQLKVWCARANDRFLGTALNFGCHPTALERRNQSINADYPGYTVKFISEKTGGTPALFLQGAAGNICPVNPLDPERNEVGDDWARHMGCELAGQALRALERAEPGIGPLRVGQAYVGLSRRSIPDDLLRQARRQADSGVLQQPSPALSDYGVEHFRNPDGAKISLADFMRTPYWTEFYKRETIALADDFSKTPSVDFEIMAICQDNWAMVFLPCELFVELGDAIAGTSPFRHTGVITLSNGWHGYIPTALAFKRTGGYETKSLSSSFLAANAGEIVLKETLKLLNKLK